jgi:hypothetical protein
MDAPTLMSELFSMWVEPDTTRRRAAIQELFHPDIRFFDHDGEFSGYDGLIAFSDALQKRFPTARFQLLSPPVVLGDAVRAYWRFGTDQGGVTGMDFIILDGGKVRTLYAFVDLGT